MRKQPSARSWIDGTNFLLGRDLVLPALGHCSDHAGDCGCGMPGSSAAWSPSMRAARSPASRPGTEQTTCSRLVVFDHGLLPIRNPNAAFLSKCRMIIEVAN